MTAPLFHDAAIKQMRQIQEGNLPHTCQVKAVALGARVGGVAPETESNVGAPFNCLVRVAGSAAELLSADQLKNAARYEVVVPISVTSITRKHRLAVSGNFEGVAWSMTLEVIGPLGPKLAQVMRRYLCTPISGTGA